MMNFSFVIKLCPLGKTTVDNLLKLSSSISAGLPASNTTPALPSWVSSSKLDGLWADFIWLSSAGLLSKVGHLVALAPSSSDGPAWVVVWVCCSVSGLHLSFCSYSRQQFPLPDLASALWLVISTLLKDLTVGEGELSLGPPLSPESRSVAEWGELKISQSYAIQVCWAELSGEVYHL